MATDYKKMLEEEGCPNCGSTETHEQIVSVNDQDGFVACVCDECGFCVLRNAMDSGAGDKMSSIPDAS